MPVNSLICVDSAENRRHSSFPFWCDYLNTCNFHCNFSFSWCCSEGIRKTHNGYSLHTRISQLSRFTAQCPCTDCNQPVFLDIIVTATFILSSAVRSTLSLKLWIESVAQPVAKQVKSQDGCHYKQTRNRHQMGCVSHKLFPP